MHGVQRERRREKPRLLLLLRLTFAGVFSKVPTFAVFDERRDWCRIFLFFSLVRHLDVVLVICEFFRFVL
jgi:hypothetical protein